MDFSHLSPEQLAIKQQAAIQQLQAASSSQMTSNMLAMSSANNAAQLAANQQRMQQLQMEILRGQQVIANQLDMRRSEMRNVMHGAFVSMPGADPGTTGVFGRNIGMGPGGYTTQSLGGQFYNAGLGRLMNRATGGFFFQDYAFQFGASRAETEKRAQDQLTTSLESGLRGVYAYALPQAVRSRFGHGFIGEKGETQQLVAGMLSHLRGRSLGTMATPDKLGAGLRSELVTSLTNQLDTSFSNLNTNMFGHGSVTTEDMKHLRGGVLAALDERTIQSAVSGRSEGDAAKVLAARTDQLVGGIKALSDKLQLNAEATGKLVQANRSLGFSWEHLSSGANFIRGRQTSIQMPGDELIGRYNRAAFAGRSMGFDSAQFAQVTIGQAEQMTQDMTGKYYDLMSSQGGDTNLERAMNYRAAITAGAPSFARRFGATLGILAGSGDNPLAEGSGMLGMSSVASALAKNPYAGLEAMQDPKAQARLLQNSREILFRKARSLPVPRVLQIQWYASQLGLDPVMAKRDFDAQADKDDKIRNALSAVDRPASELGNVLNYQAAGIEQGLPIQDLPMADLVKSYVRAGNDRTREGMVKSLPSDLNKEIRLNDLKSLADYLGTGMGLFGKKKSVSGLGVLELPEATRASAQGASQQEILDAVQGPGATNFPDFPSPKDVISSVGDTVRGAKQSAADMWSNLRASHASYESRSSASRVVEVRDSRLAGILERMTGNPILGN